MKFLLFFLDNREFVRMKGDMPLVPIKPATPMSCAIPLIIEPAHWYQFSTISLLLATKFNLESTCNCLIYHNLGLDKICCNVHIFKTFTPNY